MSQSPPKLAAIAIIALLGALAASPALGLSFFINSATDPALSGALLYDFNDQPDNLQFTSASVFSGAIDISSVSGNLRFDDQWTANFGTTGISLETRHLGPNTDFQFDFTTSVTTFGFHVNALDIDWTMEIFDDSGGLIDSYTIPNQSGLSGNNRRGYAGAFSDTPISRVRISAATADFALIDDFSIIPVPEPAAGRLLLVGLALASARSAQCSSRTGNRSV